MTAEGAGEKWETMWQSLRPGEKFDRLSVEPMLVELVEAGKFKPPMSVLLPGVGRGYEAVYLRKQGFDVVGLDISPTSVKEAKKYSEENGVTDIKYVVGDYFKDGEWSEPYDLVIDYIFKCALSPELEGQWVKRSAELVKPGGYFLYFIFPIAEFEGGPPFSQNVEHIKEILVQAGLEVVQIGEPVSDKQRPNGKIDAGMSAAIFRKPT